MKGLTSVATPDLERVLRAIERGDVRSTVTPESLIAARLNRLVESVRPLHGSSTDTARQVLEAVLAERRTPPETRVSLVWTGPETRGSAARDTAVVVRELFEQAQDHVLIAGFSFYRGAAILALLHAVMQNRGVRAELFVHIDAAREQLLDHEEYIERQVTAWVDSESFGVCCVVT